MREVRIDATADTDVVSVKEVKDWGKIPGDAEDDIIADLIKSCRELQEQWTMRSYIQKTLTAHWDQIEGFQIELPYGPVKSITSIKRVYADGTLSDTLTAGTDYFISGMDFKVVNLYKRWSSAGGQIQVGMRVVYVTGHGSETGENPIPEPLKETVLRHVITDYDMRDDLEQSQTVLYDWVKEALAPYRRETWL